MLNIYQDINLKLIRYFDSYYKKVMKSWVSNELFGKREKSLNNFNNMTDIGILFVYAQSVRYKMDRGYVVPASEKACIDKYLKCKGFSSVKYWEIIND